MMTQLSLFHTYKSCFVRHHSLLMFNIITKCRSWLADGDQETDLVPNKDFEMLPVQTKVSNGCRCPNDCYKQFLRMKPTPLILKWCNWTKNSVTFS